MSGGTNIFAKGSGSVCSGQEASGTECYTLDLTTGLKATEEFHLSESVASSLTLKGDATIVHENELAVDDTYFTPIQFVPTPPGQGVTPRWALQFKIFELSKEVEAGNAKLGVETGAAGEIKEGESSVTGPAEAGLQTKMTYRAAGEPGTFNTYLELGGISVVPESLGEYRPSLPFVSLPGQEIPSTFAIRGGLKELPLGIVSVGVEGGMGRGGVVTGSSGRIPGWSIVGTSQARLAKDLRLGLAYEHTEQHAPAEPELNQFYEGDGDSKVAPGVYGFLEIKDTATLYGGRVEKKVTQLDFSGGEGDGEADGRVEHRRKVSYGAVTVPLQFVDDASVGVMYAVQNFNRDYTDGARGVQMDATGHLTTVQVDKGIGAGFSLSATLFFQDTSGSGIDSFSNNGAFFKLAWAGDWDMITW